MGSVVSLHSVYLGAAVVGAALAFVGVFPLVQWVWKIPKRHAERRQRNSPSKKFESLHSVILREFNLIEQDMEYGFGLARTPANRFTQREVIKFELAKCGISTPNPMSHDETIWHTFITNLVPLSLRGRIDEAKILGEKFAGRSSSSNDPR